MRRDPRITWSRKSGFLEALARPLARRLRRAAMAMRVAEHELAVLGVRIVSDDEISAMHWRYMGIAGPTDVLSFRTLPWMLSNPADTTLPSAETSPRRDSSSALADRMRGHSLASEDLPALYGDLALSWRAVLRQATSANASALLDEATRLLVHGLAHLEGHDHRHRADARRMHAQERLALRSARTLDHPRPYASVFDLRARTFGGLR